MSAGINAEQFVKKLKSYRSPDELKKIQRYFKSWQRRIRRGRCFHWRAHGAGICACQRVCFELLRRTTSDYTNEIPYIADVYHFL
jgi:hypothetical protein